MREWRASPPDAFVIDLSRLPSHGKEIAIALRQSPKTRAVPIVFCGGEPAKVEALRAALPDATYTSVYAVVSALRRSKPLAQAVRPTAMMDRYGGRTVAQKLGVAAASKVRLVDPPRDIATVLAPLPDGVEFVESPAPVTLCFVNSVDDVRQSIHGVRNWAAKSKLWILWRKKNAPGHNGVTETLVRETGLALGLVDYKICAVDKVWSALLFARKQ
jgi:hypothetical protein